jgi:phage tail protein X
MTTTLSDTIAATLTGNPSSADVQAVLDKARKELERLAGLRDKLRAVALHPTTPAGEVRSARERIADAEFSTERMQAAVPALEEALTRALAREEEAVRIGEYEAARARVAEAEEALARYPAVAAELVSILRTCATAVAAVDKAQASMPAGAAPITLPPALAGFVPAGEEEIVGEEDCEVWVSERTGVVVEEKQLRGSDPIRRPYGAGIGPEAPHAVKRKARRQTVRLPQPRREGGPIYTVATIPDVMPGVFLWRTVRSSWGPTPAEKILAANPVTVDAGPTLATETRIVLDDEPTPAKEAGAAASAA